jgi:hypothetical protein
MTIVGIVFLVIIGLTFTIALGFSIICQSYKNERIKEHLWILFVCCAAIGLFSLVSEIDKEENHVYLSSNDYEIFIAKNKIIVVTDEKTFEFGEHKDYRDISENLENIDFYTKEDICIYGFPTISSEELIYKIK